MTEERKQHLSKKIEELKNKIYSKTETLKKKARTHIHEDVKDVPSAWKDEEGPTATPKKKKRNLLQSSMFRKLFFGALTFFVLSIGFGVYMFFGGSNTVSADNIDITVLGNAFANGGEELPLQIQITNRNNVPLEYTDLLIEYQRGAGLGEDIHRERIGVGTISAGAVIKQLLNVTLFGQQGTTRDIAITLEYRVPGSNAIFVKQKAYTVNISSAPVSLLVTGPENSGSNQNLSFTIRTNLNTPEPVENMMVVVEYPRGFDFKSATPAPTYGDNIWVLGDLAPGNEKEIKIDGVIVAQPTEQRAFNVYVGQQKDVNEREMGVQFNSQSYVVAIQKPLLDTKITVNGNDAAEVVVGAPANIQGKIEWRNTTGQRLTDVEIVAELEGPLINFSSVTTAGFFESATNKIIWNRQNLPAFADIKPGQSGTLVFGFQTLPPTNGSSSAINLSMKVRDPEHVNSFLDIKNFDRQVLRVATNLQMVGHALYHSGVFQNTGPLPPTPGQPTTYTISWSLANSLNDISGAEVRAKLPIYVDYVGSTSPGSESVTYNQTTKEIVWNIGTIKKGTGSNLPPKTLQFQVRLNPSATQIGTSPFLVQNITYKGTDVASNALLTGNIPNITTTLVNDLNYNYQHDKVE